MPVRALSRHLTVTLEEITRLLEAAAKSKNKELRGAVIVALNTGLRLGELIGLTWDRVDLSRGVMRIEMTKSGRRREVPMNAASYAALVNLGPQSSGGRVFKTRYIKTAYNNAVAAAQMTTSSSTPFCTRSHPGRSCGGSL